MIWFINNLNFFFLCLKSERHRAKVSSTLMFWVMPDDCRAFLWTLIIITTGVLVLGGVLGDVVTLMVRSEAVVCAQPQHAAG